MRHVRQVSRAQWVVLAAPTLVLALAASHPAAAEDFFRRGDANADGRVDAADGERILAFVQGEGLGRRLPCADAADANDDGRVDAEDALLVLAYADGGDAMPAPPGPHACGPDATRDTLECASYAAALCTTEPSPLDPAPVLNTTVLADADTGILVTWENPPGAPADTPIAVLADYVEVGVVDGAATSFTLDPTLLPAGAIDVCVVNWSGFPGCAFHVPQAPEFLRGDANGTGEIDISDAIFTLTRLFLSSEPFPCADAADANDDASLDVSDTIWTLENLFLGGDPPPAPFPACGADPTGDGITCQKKGACPVVEACACKEHKLRKVYINTIGTALPRGTMHFYTWLTCTKTTARDECEGTLSMTVSGVTVTQTAKVPCDGEPHTGEFKNFKIDLTPNKEYSITVAVACGGQSQSSTLKIKLDANGNIDPAASDQDGDGTMDKDDKSPSDPD
jgi:hypothetical protein